MHRRHSTQSLSVGKSTRNLGYNCNTPEDFTCPNEPYPPPSPGAPTPPPYSQYLKDSRVMASASNVVGDDRQRLVYGVDVSRGVALVDGGTGDPPPAANAYAQTAAYVQQQWFGPRGMSYTWACAEKTITRKIATQAGAHCHRRSAGYETGARAFAQAERRDGVSRADG